MTGQTNLETSQATQPSFVVEASLNDVTHAFTVRDPPRWSDLESQIRRVFSLSSRISVTYLDDDGDAITLDSDVELNDLVSLTRANGRNHVGLAVQVQEGDYLQPQQTTSSSGPNDAMNVERNTMNDSLPTTSGAATLNSLYPSLLPLPEVQPYQPSLAQQSIPPSEGKGKAKEGSQQKSSGDSTVDQIHTDLQTAMEHLVASTTSNANPNHGPRDEQPAPTSQPSATTGPNPSSAEVTDAFNRVVEEITRVIQLLSMEEHERNPEESDRLKRELMRDVGILVGQLRTTITSNASTLFATVQAELARIIEQIRIRAAAYQAEVNRDHPGDTSSSDSSSDSDVDMMGQFDDWAYGPSAAAGSRRMARDERKAAKRAEKQARKAEKQAEKQERKRARSDAREQRKAFKKARKEMEKQTRAYARATADYAADTLRTAASQFAASLASTISNATSQSNNTRSTNTLGQPTNQIGTQPLPFGLNPDVLRNLGQHVANQIQSGLAAGRMPPPYPGSQSGTPYPGVGMPFGPQSPLASMMGAFAGMPRPPVPPTHGAAPPVPPNQPAPPRDFGYQVRRLREMGFFEGRNGESLERMLDRMDGDVDKVVSELLGA